jgi:hypothetical protein
MLTPEDESHLAALGNPHAVSVAEGMLNLVISAYKLPEGYEPQQVDLLLRLPAGFPDAAPDMFWTSPIVSYVGGGEPAATSDRLQFDGRVWQRWSRHLAQAWRPGIDNLQTYLRLIRTDLEAGPSALRAAA